MNDKLKFYRSTLVQLTKGLIGYTPMHKLAEDADKVAKEIMKKVDEYENSFNYQTHVNENSTITCNYPNFFKSVNPDYLKTEPMRTIVDNGPQYPSDNKEELDYVCKLTQWDIDDLKQRLNLAIKAFDRYKTDGEEFKQRAEAVLKMYINDVIEFLDNKDNIRTKCQNNQIARKIEKANQKSYGTLGEHWKELMVLFDIKSNYSVSWKKLFKEVIIPDLKLYGHVCQRSQFSINYYRNANDVYNSLGIEFIEDFVKACEKCEE